MTAGNTLGARELGELLTQTGPDRSMGQLLRCYWQPIALSTDVASDGPPRATRILSEDLVLFRDTTGQPGLLAGKCAHRCADLSYGRVEHGGLRCIYHGWLYDRNGQCLEQPGEPNGGEHRNKIRQRANPCVEQADSMWAYLGPNMGHETFCRALEQADLYALAPL